MKGGSKVRDVIPECVHLIYFAAVCINFHVLKTLTTNNSDHPRITYC